MSEDYRQSQSYKEAYLLAARYCGGAERCFYDVKAKFRQWQVSSVHQESILEALQKEQFIDEQRYANAFVKDKFYLNAWGRIKIQHHLRQRQIPDSLIRHSFSIVIDETDYVECLQKLIEKKVATVKAKDFFSKKARLMQYAQSRGFESFLVTEVLDRYLTE